MNPNKPNRTSKPRKKTKKTNDANKRAKAKAKTSPKKSEVGGMLGRFLPTPYSVLKYNAQPMLKDANMIYRTGKTFLDANPKFKKEMMNTATKAMHDEKLRKQVGHLIGKYGQLFADNLYSEQIHLRSQSA
jgi:hypothetical protein